MTESEWTTRKTRIDARSKALNPKWNIIPYHAGLETATLKRLRRVYRMFVSTSMFFSHTR